MPDTRRLEKIERKAEEQAPRSETKRPMSYYDRLCAMTYEELEAEQARLRAGAAQELEKLNGGIPPWGIKPDHPAYALDTFERRSWLLDTVIGPRLDRDIADIAARHNASQDLELRKRLAAEYNVLQARLRALNARYDDRAKWMEARDKAAAEARKESCA